VVEPNVISIREALKLRSVDYPQGETYWYYIFQLEKGMWELKSWKELATMNTDNAEILAAPTPGELGEQLPVGFKSCRRGEKDWLAWYYNYEHLSTIKQEWEAETEADVRAKGYGWLSQNNLLDAKMKTFTAQIEEVEKFGISNFLVTRAERVEWQGEK